MRKMLCMILLAGMLLGLPPRAAAEAPAEAAAETPAEDENNV